MATLNVRIDDRIRDELEVQARDRGITVSEHVRRLVEESVLPVQRRLDPEHGDQDAPPSLDFMDRKVLSMLHRILARVLPEDANDVDGDREYQLERAETLERGFTREYWMEAAGFSTELSQRDCDRVADILDMFRIARYSIAELDRAGRAVPDELRRQLTFHGFDYNEPLELQMAQYVRYLISQDKWTEVQQDLEEHDGGNSHSPMLPTYLRMLSAYRRIMDSRDRGYGLDGWKLSADELDRIALEWVHPSHR